MKIKYQFRRVGRSFIAEAWLPKGLCFSGGEHSKVLDYPGGDGTKREMFAILKQDVEDDDIIECECEDCNE